VPKKVTTNKRAKQESRKSKLPYSARNHLLTPGERRFYHDGLAPAVRGRWLIAFKPRLADLITTENAASNHFRRIGMKHVDFALLTPRRHESWPPSSSMMPLTGRMIGKPVMNSWPTLYALLACP
jgi:hypothetical protein